MSANIRPAGVFDTDYGQDIALNRTRSDKLISNGLLLLLLLVPLLTVEGPFGLNILPQLKAGVTEYDIAHEIDYQFVTPSLAPRLKSCFVQKAPRWSDHAPYVVDYAD